MKKQIAREIKIRITALINNGKAYLTLAMHQIKFYLIQY